MTWKQNMSLWLFESEVFDPLPNAAQMPAGSCCEYNQGVIKAIAFLEGQLGTAHLEAGDRAVFGP